MDNKIEVVIIGGSNTGVSAATRIRRLSESAEITIVEQSSFIGSNQAALPYFISGKLESIETITAGIEEKLSEIYDINLIKNYEAVKIDRKNKVVLLKNNDTLNTIEISYDKLILATGFSYKNSEIPLSNYNNLFELKNLEDAIKIKKYINDFSVKKISILGSNYISLKTSSALIDAGFEVTIIDSKSVLLNNFDDEFNFVLKNELTKVGAKVFLNTQVKKLRKNSANNVSKIELNYIDIDTDMILFFDNLIPNTSLAKISEIDTNKKHSIIVNEKFETSDPNIYAGGSAVELFDHLTKESCENFSINQSNFHGRAIGASIFNMLKSNTPNIQNYFFKLKNFSLGIAGISEVTAKEAGFDYVVSEIFTGDHERFFTNTNQIHIKIIADKINRTLLGAQVSGKGGDIVKKIDVFVTSIAGGLTVDQISELNLSYNPDISIIGDPVNIVSMIAQNILDGISTSVKSSDIPKDDMVCILDIRTASERNKLAVANSLWIPLNEIRKRIEEIPRDKKVYVYGHVGIRGYIAERILKGYGFKSVFNILGGISSIKLNENIE